MEEDPEVSQQPPWQQGGRLEPDPKTVPATNVASGVLGFVGLEFNKFSKGIKTFIRWFALIVAVAFGLNYFSQQLRLAVCQWQPYSSLFCESPKPRPTLPPSDAGSVSSAEGWISSEVMLPAMAALFVLLIASGVARMVAEKFNKTRLYNALSVTALLIRTVLAVISGLVLGRLIQMWL